MSADLNQRPTNSGLEDGNPFHNGLAILARIIFRVYQRDLQLLRLNIPNFAHEICGGVPTYCGYQPHLEWAFIGADGNHYLVTATLNN